MTEKKAQTTEKKASLLKVEVYLSDPIAIDDQTIDKLILKEPTGSDLKGLSIASIFTQDARSVGLLTARIADGGVIVDRQLIAESGIANIAAIVEGLATIIDDQVPDIEDVINEKGDIVDVILPQPFKNHKKLSFRKPGTGELRGLSMVDLNERNVKAIMIVASRCVISEKLTKDDFETISFTNLILIAEAIERSLKGNDRPPPKIIRG